MHAMIAITFCSFGDNIALLYSSAPLLPISDLHGRSFVRSPASNARRQHANGSSESKEECDEQVDRAFDAE